MAIIQNPEKHWNEAAANVLVGRTIVEARYMTAAEAERFGWRTRPVIFLLDDGTFVFPSSDDEGNGAGALFTNNPTAETLPVLSLRYRTQGEAA